MGKRATKMPFSSRSPDQKGAGGKEIAAISMDARPQVVERRSACGDAADEQLAQRLVQKLHSLHDENIAVKRQLLLLRSELSTLKGENKRLRTAAKAAQQDVSKPSVTAESIQTHSNPPVSAAAPSAVQQPMADMERQMDAAVQPAAHRTLAYEERQLHDALASAGDLMQRDADWEAQFL